MLTGFEGGRGIWARWADRLRKRRVPGWSCAIWAHERTINKLIRILFLHFHFFFLQKIPLSNWESLPLTAFLWRNKQFKSTSFYIDRFICIMTNIDRYKIRRRLQEHEFSMLLLCFAVQSSNPFFLIFVLLWVANF